MGTVLTVDDSVPVRRLVRTCLAAAGLTVIEAAAAAEGLKLLRAQAVDLVITDINMPGMSGFHLIEAIRGELGDRSTPVLVLSSEDAEAQQARGRLAGADAWLAKPFSSAELIAAVDRLIGRPGMSGIE